MTDTTYPNGPGPGFKEGETSREAATQFASRASTLRDKTYEHIRRFPLRTADQIAEALGETIMAIRPRVSELRKGGLIVNDGRGVNSSGMQAHRWRVAGAELGE